MFRYPKHLFILLIITSLACAVPGLTLPNTNDANTALPTESVNFSSPTSAFTPTFTFTPTLIQLTRPNTETPTITLTLDLNTATQTNTPFPTATIELVIITVSRPTHCRIGPGTAYEIAGTLLVGEEATVLGRNPSNKYWYIPNPDPGIEYCWVWGEYASFTGSNLLVPMLTPLPTPTSTATAPPPLPLGAIGRKLEKCNDSWWIDIEVTNKSKLSLRSVRVEILDTDTGITKFNSSDGFINRDGCGTYYQTETLEANKSYIVSGPTFPYNIKGNTLRVFVTVCTEKDQKGVCNTIKIAVKP